jgi:hypothetical protein
MSPDYCFGFSKEDRLFAKTDPHNFRKIAIGKSESIKSSCTLEALMESRRTITIKYAICLFFLLKFLIISRGVVIGKQCH